ncbi:type II secretion system protein [Coleofasciculus sp. FACHB-64]|uniref:hormogonium polysaccharide secretion pseudopilin HpsB n=1 Tax=Cyanophyceae TaxID=3028117 RepID=UPI0016887AB3|nr:MULTISPECIES: hormogonium polysaccharide secretion pseudopilin HpsB [unclassified Coleofasciculus]MBD1837607.1 type II secretion system protein [Coleofasciculus sp. FACHB-501]MBD2048172.1 type II secretion system protein [Coleofasciculus sp. FACHB-64]
MIKRKRKHKHVSSQSSETGFTLIESLLAIIVIAILMTAIAPVIVLSTATRLQAKRVELASKAASTYIDGVRSGKVASPPITSTTMLGTVAPPTSGTLTCSKNIDYCTSPANLYCVDGDGNGTCTTDSLQDMIVQGFGYSSSYVTATDASKGYSLGVRVYRADAFKSGTTLVGGGGETQSSFTGGVTATKQIDATRREAPLVQTTTEIAPTGQSSLNDLCARIKKPDGISKGCQ